MSDPIGKVRGGGLPSAQGVASSEGGGFGEAIEAAKGADVAALEQTGAADPLRALAEGLEGKRIGAPELVDRLVARALDAPEARSLSDAGRRELERSLRDALANDPTLLSLQADLERG